MIGLSTFSLLIIGALIITSFAPLILIGLFIWDWKKGEIW